MVALMRCAAIQLEEAVPADADANLAATERLVDEAVAAGATIVALPEFFTTGIGFRWNSPRPSCRRTAKPLNCC